MFKYIVSVSGGKDSTACILWALENLNKNNLEFVFIDTKWEHELTYKYLDYLEERLNIKIHRLETIGMLELCKQKKFMPNRVMRFCTEYLKIKPFNEYLFKNYIEKNIDFIVIQGVRRFESKKRENTPVFVEIKQIYNRKSFIVKTLYPIAYWTDKQVFKYLQSKNIEPNPLYKKGFKRVGCFPCVYESKQSLKLIANEDFYINRLRNLEKTISTLVGKEVKFFTKKLDYELMSKSLFEGGIYERSI